MSNSPADNSPRRRWIISLVLLLVLLPLVSYSIVVRVKLAKFQRICDSILIGDSYRDVIDLFAAKDQKLSGWGGPLGWPHAENYMWEQKYGLFRTQVCSIEVDYEGRVVMATMSYYTGWDPLADPLTFPRAHWIGKVLQLITP